MPVSRFVFGPFELDPVRLELRRDGAKLNVGGRACRVLLALVQSAGRVVSQADLLAAAWPGLHVEDVNLRVHIVALRKALSGVSGGAFDITTVPREGYVFSAPVSVLGETETVPRRTSRAPRRLSPLIGRGEDLDRLRSALAMHRIVSLVGAGGIGKTALALDIVAGGQRQADAECVFVDFTTSVSSSQVTGRLFEALELEGAPNDVAAHIVRALETKRILLVLDNCEHVIGHVAALVALLTSETDGVSILATSREPLRVSGELVIPLQPLSCPPDGAALTANSAMGFPAVQMFVEAACLRSPGFVVDDANASLLGELCRRLDGIPLALELAAASSGTMTIRELAEGLDDRFAVLTRGARTALPRHRTLQAALDWSFEALEEQDAAIMCRLGVFPGRFTAGDAEVVAGGGRASGSPVRQVLADLVAKSLLTVDVGPEIAWFRFLETMRVYARLKLLESDEAPAVYARFVDHTRARLAGMNAEPLSATDLRQRHGSVLDDWRAAHDWAIRTGDRRTALDLMADGAGFCQSLNVKAEYIERAATTLRTSLPAEAPDNAILRSEMLVCDRMGQMLIDTQPTNFIASAETAALRALALARQLNAPDVVMSALVTLTVAAQTAADIGKVTAYTAQVHDFAHLPGNAEFVPTANYLTGYARYYKGDLEPALSHLDEALRGAAPDALDHIANVRTSRARALWQSGEFEPALAELEAAHRVAVESGHGPTLSWVAWGGGVCVHLWAGTLERAAASARLFEDLAREYSTPGWAAYIPSLRQAMALLGTGGSFGSGPVNWTPHVTSHADVMASIHCAFHRPLDLQRIQASQGHWCAAEHFRGAGEHHLAAGRSEEAERCFQRALAEARGRGAAAWEIRATLSLSRVRLQRAEAAATRALLEPLLERFPDRRFNTDLSYAATLLADC